MQHRLAIVLAVALALPAAGELDDQIRDYLTSGACHWPDFPRDPDFRICPPTGMDDAAWAAVRDAKGRWVYRGPNLTISRVCDEAPRCDHLAFHVASELGTAAAAYELRLRVQFGDRGSVIYRGGLSAADVVEIAAAAFGEFAVTAGGLGVVCSRDVRLLGESGAFRFEWAGDCRRELRHD